MPPSKKKSLRMKFNPSQHLNNIQLDPKSVIEQLFLLRRFEDALELSYGILSELCKREEEEDKIHKNKQPMKPTDESLVPQEKIMLLRHLCKDSEMCGCSAIVVMVIQIMFEMGKAPLATPFACKFYKDLCSVPYDIVFVCVNLLVNSLANFAEAKRILTTVLDKNRRTEQGTLSPYHHNSSSPSPSPSCLGTSLVINLSVTPVRCSKGVGGVVYTQEQREILLEFLLFHVLVPLQETQEALDMLAGEKSLPVQKREGWTTCLTELHNAKLLKAQQELQRQQQLHTTQSSPNSPLLSSNKPDSSQNSLVPHNSVAMYCSAMVTRSKLATMKVWTYIRTFLGKYRFGSFAAGIAIVYLAIHLFAALRRRSSPKRITNSSNDNNNNTNTNNNNNNNRNRNNNYNKTTTTTTTKQPTKPKVQHYRGEDQIQGGIWSNMTKLLSDALSVK